MRRFPVHANWPYEVFYIIRPSSVEIVRVIDARRDYVRLLEDEDEEAPEN